MRYGVEIMKIPPLLLIVNFRLSRSSTHRILNLIKAEPEPMIYNQNGRLFPSLLYLYKDVYLEVGRRRAIAGQEDIIIEIAQNLANGKK